MPSSGAVIHMLTHRPEDPEREGADQAALRRTHLIEAFMRSVWPFNRPEFQLGDEPKDRQEGGPSSPA